MALVLGFTVPIHSSSAGINSFMATVSGNTRLCWVKSHLVSDRGHMGMGKGAGLSIGDRDAGSWLFRHWGSNSSRSSSRSARHLRQLVQGQIPIQSQCSPVAGLDSGPYARGDSGVFGAGGCLSGYWERAGCDSLIQRFPAP